MSNFFENFPLVNYTFGDEGVRSIFQNISAYTDIFQSLIDDDTQYETYQVTDIDRPDTLSYSLYDTPEFYWTFYLLNPDLIRKGWPIGESKLYEKKDDMFPEFALQLRYNPNYDSDLSAWDLYYGDSDGPSKISYFNSYKLNNQNAVKTLFEKIKPGCVITGNTAGSEVGHSTGIVTRIDYNLGIIYLKGWNGIYKVEIFDKGTGYDVPPKVIIEGAGKGAYAEALVDSSGGVSSVRVYKPGYDYETFPWNGRNFERSPYTGGPFRSIEPVLRSNYEDFLFQQTSTTWFTDSDKFIEAIKLRPTQVRFERQSDQKGRDAIGYVRVNDLSVLESPSSIYVWNLGEDYRNWDFRTHANGPVYTITAPWNLFGSFNNAGAFANAQTKYYDSAYTSVIPVTIARNPANKPGEISYFYGVSGYPNETAVTVYNDSYGIAMLPDLRDNGKVLAPWTDSSDLFIKKYVPENFIDYSEPSYYYEKSNVVLGQKRNIPGRAISNFPRRIFNTGGYFYRNLSIYNVTQNYYDSPAYDPDWVLYNEGTSSPTSESLYNIRFNPFKQTGGTVRVHVSEDGRTGNYISGLTGNPGDEYSVYVQRGYKNRRDRWDNVANGLELASNVTHHWEDNLGNRIIFNLFDSDTNYRWYDFYDTVDGTFLSTRTIPGLLPGFGFYEILDSMSGTGLDYVRVSNFENILNQATEQRTIKVLKPDSVRKIANAFKKAIRGTN